MIGIVYYVYKNYKMVTNKVKTYLYKLNPESVKDNVQDVLEDGAEYVSLGADTVKDTITDTLNVKCDKNNDPNDSLTKVMPQKNNYKKVKSCADVRRKEVFNIEKNVFTYEEAKYVCKALGSELATYNQVKKAHKNGGNWCNYGWSANQMALYPIQKNYYDNMSSDDKKKGICGKPGVNGGFFKDNDLKFGVNCYGYKPNISSDKVIYLDKNEKAPKRKDAEGEKKLIDIRSKLKKYNIDPENSADSLKPFSSDKWSQGSCKRSYLIKEEFLDGNNKSYNSKSFNNLRVEDFLNGETMTEEFYNKIHTN